MNYLAAEKILKKTMPMEVLEAMDVAKGADVTGEAYHPRICYYDGEVAVGSTIDSSLYWMKTTQGHRFWSALCDKYGDLYVKI